MTGLDLDEWGRDLALMKGARAKVRRQVARDPALVQQQIDALADRVAALANSQADSDHALAAARGQIATLQGRLQQLEESRPARSPAVSVMLSGAAYGWVTRLAVSVADEWNVAAPDLLGAYRGEPIIRPRYALAWLVREASGYSLPLLGRLLNRDHSSVKHALHRAKEWRESDETFRHTTDQLLIIARRFRAEGRMGGAA